MYTSTECNNGRMTQSKLLAGELLNVLTFTVMVHLLKQNRFQTIGSAASHLRPLTAFIASTSHIAYCLHKPLFSLTSSPPPIFVHEVQLINLNNQEYFLCGGQDTFHSTIVHDLRHASLLLWILLLWLWLLYILLLRM